MAFEIDSARESIGRTIHGAIGSEEARPRRELLGQRADLADIVADLFGGLVEHGGVVLQRLGADLALCCDFVIGARNATFVMSYVLRGLIPDGGGMYFLPRRVGLARAKELIFSGRMIDADEAHGINMIEHVSDPDTLIDDAVDMARSMIAGSADALALAKSIMNQSFESTPEEIFALGSQAQGICYTTDSHHDAVAAFLDKRK